MFSVDANGFVALAGGGQAIDSVAVQTGTSPIAPTVAGLITINGAVVSAGTNPIRSDGTGANTLAIEVQISQALAAADATKIGLSNFDSSSFAVAATGFVTLSGTGAGKTITGNSGGALSPTAGNWNIFGASVAAGTSPVATSGSGSTLTVNVQKSQAIASTDATKVGLAAFDSAKFTVDANGFVTTSGTTVLDTLTGNSGGAISPTAGNINTLGTGSITIAGSGSTLTTQLTGLTNHAIQIGAGTATLTQLGAGTTGQVLQTNTAADPTWSTATYPSTTTANRILYSSSNNVVGQITSTTNGVLITDNSSVPSLLANSATPGFVLTANAGAPPSWQTTGTTGVVTINGDSGSATGTTITFTTGGATGNGTALFTGSGSTVTLSSSTAANNNTGWGTAALAALSGGGNNTAFGWHALNALVSGTNCTAVGMQALNNTTGSNNTAVGYQALSVNVGGTSNVAMGYQALVSTATGTNNIALGASAGSSFTLANSSNIAIGNIGVVGQSNTIRIGTQGSGAGQQNVCYVAGVAAVSVSNLNVVTIDTTTGQLGSQAAANVGTVTQFDVLVGGASSAIASVGPGSAGQILQSGGNAANPAYSTATYPSTASTSGKVLVSDGTNFLSTSLQGNSTALKAPTVQKFTSGSGTYTTPTSPGPLYIRVVLVGPGGGGSASNTNNGAAGSAATTFGTTLLSGGAGAAGLTTGGGAGGAASLGAATGIAVNGAAGTGGGSIINSAGGIGGSSFMSGAGSGGNINANGGTAVTNSGGGGGGGGGTGASQSGCGGGGGGYVDAIITAPSATYSYVIGAGGNGGTAGGQAGGAGAAGQIVVYEYYQ